VYGQRCANKIFAAAQTILAIGCRLSIWTVGYDFPRPGQRLVMVDVDESEVRKFPNAEWIQQDAKAFIEELLGGGCGGDFWRNDGHLAGWRVVCQTWRGLHPWLEPGTHDDGAYINPHRFMSRLQPHLAPDEIIVTDCATGNLCAHQILALKPPQRLMTSGGLGEMGCGLPGAIGASFATGRRVICLNTDGSMMLNLQELQTIAHHRLPVKIIVFSNDGYAMIRATQKNLRYSRIATDTESGVSCPDFLHIAGAFGIPALRMAEPDADLGLFLGIDGPALLDVPIDPEYAFGPKLNPIRHADGTVTSPAFDQMSPVI
jgi:acetolactate synthase-1/2/3 large subunit